MISECKDHGYFRDIVCPLCGQEGRFLMNSVELERLGRTMAGVLRHFPEKFDLEMDSNGFVDLRKFVSELQKRQVRLKWLRPHHIIAIIETDPKGRYECRDDKIRATYGHSIDVDLDLPTAGTPEKLYYPTTQEEVDIVLETGLRPSDRKKVHLSRTFNDAMTAGKVRTADPVILEIDVIEAEASSIIFQKAGNTIFLTDLVPAEFISKAEKPSQETDEEATISPAEE